MPGDVAPERRKAIWNKNVKELVNCWISGKDSSKSCPASKDSDNHQLWQYFQVSGTSSVALDYYLCTHPTCPIRSRLIFSSMELECFHTTLDVHKDMMCTWPPTMIAGVYTDWDGCRWSRIENNSLPKFTGTLTDRDVARRSIEEAISKRSETYFHA